MGPFLLLAALEFNPQTQDFFLVFLTASRKTLCQGVPYPFHQDWLVRFKAATTIDVKQQRLSRQVVVFPAAIESSMQVIFSGSPFSPSPPTTSFMLTLSMANSVPQTATECNSPLQSRPVFGVTFVVSFSQHSSNSVSLRCSFLPDTSILEHSCVIG